MYGFEGIDDTFANCESCIILPLHNYVQVIFSLSTCKITKSKGNMQITVRKVLKI